MEKLAQLLIQSEAFDHFLSMPSQSEATESSGSCSSGGDDGGGGTECGSCQVDGE